MLMLAIPVSAAADGRGVYYRPALTFVTSHAPDDMILRIRDNCTAFNPAERANAMEPGETGKNIGIRMVYKIAGDVSYQNLLGLNVLTIRI